MSRLQTSDDLPHHPDNTQLIAHVIWKNSLASVYHNYIATDGRKKLVDSDFNGDGPGDVAAVGGNMATVLLGACK